MNKFGVGVMAVLASITVAVLSFQHYNVTTGAAVATEVGQVYGGAILLAIAAVSGVVLITKRGRANA
jgi:uncharacterized membrane protein